MIYVTLGDLITAFGEQELIQLTDKAEPRTDAIVAAVAQLEIDWANNTVDGYVQRRYGAALRDKAPPKRLVGIACDIARYRLHDERATEAVRERYRDAIRQLKDIASGVADLDVEAYAETGGRPAIKAAPRVFTSATLSDFRR